MIVDFEGAQWRHIAWDLAYLTVPWPTCWCSWRMPSTSSERALERYRNAVEDVLPYVRTARFRSDLAAAALGWAMVSVAHLLPERARRRPAAARPGPAHAAAPGADPAPARPGPPGTRGVRARPAGRPAARRAGRPLGRGAARLRPGLRHRPGRARRPLGSTACSAGMVSRRSRPAGDTAWSPSGSSTACTAATPRSSAGPWHGHASSTCRACSSPSSRTRPRSCGPGRTRRC